MANKIHGFWPILVLSCFLANGGTAQDAVPPNLEGSWAEERALWEHAQTQNSAVLLDVTEFVTLQPTDIPQGEPSINWGFAQQQLSNGFTLYWSKPRMQSIAGLLLDDPENTIRRMPDNYVVSRVMPRPGIDPKTGLRLKSSRGIAIQPLMNDWGRKLIDLYTAAKEQKSPFSVLVADLPSDIRQAVIAKAQSHWLRPGQQRGYQALFQDQFWETSQLQIRRTTASTRYDPEGQILTGQEWQMLCVVGTALDDLGGTTEIVSGLALVGKSTPVMERKP